MGKIAKKLGLALVFLVSLPLALSQNLLEPVLAPLQGLRIAENMSRFSGILGFFIYLMIFAGLAKQLMKERLGAKASAGMGIALALSVTWLEHTTSFSLFKWLAWWGLLIILFLSGILLYKVIKGASNDAIVSGCIAYTVTIFLMMGTGTGQIWKLIEEKTPLLAAFLMIGQIICIVVLVTRVPGLFKAGKDSVNETSSDERSSPRLSEAETPEPTDISSELARIQSLLADYDRLFNGYKQACDDILTTNHHHINPSGSGGSGTPPGTGGSNPPVSNDQWLRAHSLSRSISVKHNELASAINDLIDRHNFQRIPDSQKRTLVSLLTTWSDYTTRTQGYMADFENRFNNGDLPA